MRTVRLRAAGLAGTALLIALGTGAQLVHYGLGLEAAALDSSGDGGAFGVVGKLALVVASLAAWWALASSRTQDLALAALPVLLSFLSFDKALRLHDGIVAWQLLYAPVLLMTAAALVVTARRLPAPAPGLVSAGLGLLVVALALHALGGPALEGLGVVQDSWASQASGLGKHGAEVAGWLLVALGLALGVRELRLQRRDGWCGGHP
jgi:hypothetical protein